MVPQPALQIVGKPLESVVHAAPKFIYQKVVYFLAYPAAWLCDAFDISSNQVTATRFFSPLVIWALVTMNLSVWHYLAALAFFGYTDAVDGVLAGSNFENKPPSDVGSFLDPMADKFFFVGIYFYHFRNFPRLTSVTAVEEGLVLFVTWLYMKWTGTLTVQNIRANLWGKFKLGFEVVTAVLMTWFALTHASLVQAAVFLTGGAAMFCLAMSFFCKIKA